MSDFLAWDLSGQVLVKQLITALQGVHLKGVFHAVSLLESVLFELQSPERLASS